MAPIRRPTASYGRANAQRVATNPPSSVAYNGHILEALTIVSNQRVLVLTRNNVWAAGTVIKVIQVETAAGRGANVTYDVRYAVGEYQYEEDNFSGGSIRPVQGIDNVN